MATKKEAAKTEAVAAETAPAEESVGQKDVQTVDKAIGTVSEPDSPQPIQDHVTVVIPYCKEFAQGKELLFALRSWQKNVRFGINVVVIGDREDWFSEEITFIEHKRISGNAQVDTLAKLKVAMESPEVTGRFIWTNDDIYVMNPIDMAHVALPKVNGALLPIRFKGLYAENMKRTKELLERNQLPCLNYGTHTPMLLDKGCLTAMFERFPELEEDGYLFTSVYYNSLPYPTQPVYLNWQTDQVLLPVISQKPDENKVLDLLSRKVFMNNAVSGYSPWLEKFLAGVFPEPSDFEG